MEPTATRKAKSFDALKILNNDSDIFLATAKIFWMEKKPEKTRKWLKKAVALNKDNGDAWAHLFKFENEYGDEKSQREVSEQFLEADPHHGEMWTREAKQVNNWRVSQIDILKKVALQVKLYS